MFKFGTTSYILPADIITNVQDIKEYVSGIQLVLFELDEQSNLPNPIDISQLKYYKEKYNLEYFIHLPLSLNFSETNSVIRNKVIKYFEKYYVLGNEISAQYYISHLNINYNSNNKNFIDNISQTELDLFYENISKTLLLLFNEYDIKNKFLVENLNYPIKYLDYFLYNLNINLCLDIGHIFFYAQDLNSIENYKEKIKLIHLHDLNTNESDHFELNNPTRINSAITFLKKINYDGYVILEVFQKDFFLNSLNFLKYFT